MRGRFVAAARPVEIHHRAVAQHPEHAGAARRDVHVTRRRRARGEEQVLGCDEAVMMRFELGITLRHGSHDGTGPAAARAINRPRQPDPSAAAALIAADGVAPVDRGEQHHRRPDEKRAHTAPYRPEKRHRLAEEHGDGNETREAERHQVSSSTWSATGKMVIG